MNPVTPVTPVVTPTGVTPMTRSARALTTLSVMAALVLTAQAEWTLAMVVGYPSIVAVAWPLAADSYVLASLRSGRDRTWALGLMCVSVAGAHAAPILWLSGAPWWAAGAFSVIPPLVAWRVHELFRGSRVTLVTLDPVTPEVDPGPVMTLDPVTPEVDPGPVMTLDPVTPEVHRRTMAPRGAQAERVTWAMGQPGVASVGAIMTRWGVSESTAKRDRSKAMDLVSEMTP